MTTDQECKLENGWNFDAITWLVGAERALSIVQSLRQNKEGEGILVWTETVDGKSNNKKCLELFEGVSSNSGLV